MNDTDLFDGTKEYCVEITRIEQRTYTMWVRAFDAEHAEEQAIFSLDPDKPDAKEVVEQYASQIDYAGA